MAARPHPGPQPRLRPALLRRLARPLQQEVTAHGSTAALLTIPRGTTFIDRQFGVAFHLDDGRTLGKRRWGRTSHETAHRHRERDETAIALRRRHEWLGPQEAALKGTRLVWLDESGFLPTPVVRRTPAPRGQTLLLGCQDRRDRLPAISALTISRRPQHRGLSFTLLPDAPNVRGPHVVTFLRPPVFVVWDRASIHDRAAVVQCDLAVRREIETSPLPAHTPELKPDEQVWDHVEHARLANHVPADASALRREVAAELARVRRRPRLPAAFVRHPTTPRYEAHLFRYRGWSHEERCPTSTSSVAVFGQVLLEWISNERFGSSL